MPLNTTGAARWYASAQPNATAFYFLRMVSSTVSLASGLVQKNQS